MEYTELLLNVDDHIATIKLNRPNVLNATSKVLYAELHKAMDHCIDNSDVKVIVLSGAGKHFSAGHDIQEFKTAVIENKETVDAKEITKSAKMAATVKCCPKPVIAMVNGYCVGAACATALAADYRFVTPRTKFILAFINMALSGDTGAMYYLMKLIGAERTMYLLATAEPVSGEQAYSWGMASKLCANDEELHEATYAFAHKLANGPSVALQRQKALMLDYWYNDLPQYTWSEAKYMEECFKTADFIEAVNAFLEKRPAKFTGK